MRLIDADALMKQPIWLCGGWVGDSYAEGYMDALDKVEETVKSAPTIDAVPVIRCKNCKHRYITGSTTHYYVCDFMDAEYNDNGYCHHGERKDDDTD